MGLSERKVKQRIGDDPRNLSWSKDDSRFSYKHMTNLGWSDSQGLGMQAGGNPNHIAVVRRTDNGGIGMGRAKREGDDMAAGAGQAGRGLEDVLRRLASASASASPSPAPEAPATGEVKKRNKIASRQKHLHSKRLAHSSPSALAEILGVSVESLNASPSSGPSTPATPASPSPLPLETAESGSSDPKRTAEETVTTSTLSVTDYFRQKMREKMLQRQAAATANGGPLHQLDPGSYSVVKEEVKVEVGGVGWEGTKVKFEEETKVKLEDIGGEAGPSEPSSIVDEKAAKKARKEARRLAKLVKTEVKLEEVVSAPVDVKPTPEALQAEDMKAQEKREKKLRKEEKRKRAAEGGEAEAEDRKRKADEAEGGERKEKKVKKEKKEKSKPLTESG